MTDLSICGQPTFSELLSCLPDPMADIPWYSGIMPRADTRLSVEKVHLALLRGPLLCRKTYKMGLMGARFGGPWSDIDVNQNKIGATRRFCLYVGLKRQMFKSHGKLN